MSCFFPKRHTHTHTLGCLFCGVSLRQMVLAFEKVLWMVAPNCSLPLSPSPWGHKPFSPNCFCTFFPQSPVVLWCTSCLFGWVACMLARLSFAFVHQVFFEGLLNFLLSLSSVRNCVLNLSPNICGSLFCSLQKVSGASGAFFETHPEMFFGRFPQMSFTQSEINLNLSQYSYQLWSMYHCRTNILKENNTPVQLHSAKDQSWYSLDLFQESNFEFHLISSYFRPWTAKSK